jgi:hypothetical protein
VSGLAASADAGVQDAPRRLSRPKSFDRAFENLARGTRSHSTSARRGPDGRVRGRTTVGTQVGRTPSSVVQFGTSRARRRSMSAAFDALGRRSLLAEVQSCLILRRSGVPGHAMGPSPGRSLPYVRTDETATWVRSPIVDSGRAARGPRR